MLTTAARAKKWNLILSRVPNANQRSFQTGIGTAWAAKQSLIVSKVVRLICSEPDNLKSALSNFFGGVPDAFVGGRMSWIASVEISKDAYPRCCRHTPRIELRLRCVKSIHMMLKMKYFEPSISSLRLAAAILRTGKLASAATELHMSQSAASHALSSLESQLGCRLFLREHVGLSPSEAGERLRPHIEAALNSLDRIRAEAAGLTALETGSLRIAAVPSLLGTILPAILREYANRYPGIEMSVFEGTDDEVHAWTRSGIAQVGFAALPVEGVDVEVIGRDEWLALVPEKAFPGRTSIALSELMRHKFLMSGGGCERLIFQIFASAGIAITDPMMIKQMPTIHAMVAENLGVSLIPRLSLAGTRSCRALSLKPRLFRQIGMVQSTNTAPSPALEVWRSLVRARVKKSKIFASLP